MYNCSGTAKVAFNGGLDFSIQWHAIRILKVVGGRRLSSEDILLLLPEWLQQRLAAIAGRYHSIRTSKGGKRKTAYENPASYVGGVVAELERAGIAGVKVKKGSTFFYI